jgi:hypothetical protein
MPNNSFQLVPNDFNIGKDVSGRIYDDSGFSRSLFDFGHVLSVKLELTGRLIRQMPITNGGIPLLETIWEGARVHFRYTRARGNVEFFAVQTMANYFALNLRPNFSFVWFIADKNGSLDSYIASGGKIDPARLDIGDFSGAKDVEQGFSMDFATATIVGPNAPAPGASGLTF